MSIQALVIYKNEINNIGNTLLHHNDNKVSAKGERLKVLADKLHKAIAALSKEVEAQATAPNNARDAIAFLQRAVDARIDDNWLKEVRAFLKQATAPVA